MLDFSGTFVKELLNNDENKMIKSNPWEVLNSKVKESKETWEGQKKKKRQTRVRRVEV